MYRPRIRATSVLGAASLVAAAWAVQTDNAALAALSRALEGQRSVHVVLVQARSGPPGMPEMLVKIQVVPALGTMATVLQPISHQGFVSLDDGKTMRTFDPDDDFVLAQPSPNQYLPSNSWRVARIRKNYEVRFGETTKVAGRTAREIVLQPRDGRMPARRIVVDRERPLILRYTVLPAVGEPFLLSDVRSVVLSVKEAKEGFGLPPEADGRRVREFEGPSAVTDLKKAAAKLGFEISQPTGLPSGFEVHATHLVVRQDRSSLAFRLSDGMSFGTVYVRKDGGDPRRGRGGPDTSRVVKGVRLSLITVAGEPLPRDVREQILDRVAAGLE